jgi:hypothetical protein
MRDDVVARTISPPQKGAAWQDILRRHRTIEKAGRAEMRAVRYIGHLKPAQACRPAAAWAVG